MLEILTSYTWPTDGIPFAGLRIRVHELAGRLGVTLQNWEVDGLGPASGFAFRLACGRVYLLQELEIAVQYYAASGPDIYADATELATVGNAVLADEVVASLGLTHSDVVVADTAVEKIAADLVAEVAAQNAEVDTSSKLGVSD